jgi:hypothetical protein
MSKREGKQFNTVQEIFENYIPGYVVRSRKDPERGETSTGTQLAENLIEGFRVELKDHAKSANKQPQDNQR